MKFTSRSNYLNDFSILDETKDNHPIVTFSVLPDKSGIQIEEECDNHFSTTMSYNDTFSFLGKLAILFHKIKEEK